MDGDDPFMTKPVERATDDPRLVVDVGGFEGPLDLLLDLARRQKVDLHEISVLALADQYLRFVEDARALRLELAADYLVMAAWLALLKSRLLLPEPPRPEGPSAGDLATALAQKLRRLEAVREAARLLTARPQLGRDLFERGGRAADGPRPAGPTLGGTLFDLLAAYGRQQGRRGPARLALPERQVWSLAEARAALERFIDGATDWVELDGCLAEHGAEPALAATVTASTVSAALEMVREGRAELRQDRPFDTLFVKRAPPPLRLVPA